MGIGFALGAGWKLLMASGLLDTPGVLVHEELNVSFGFIPDYFSPVLYLSLMNFRVYQRVPEQYPRSRMISSIAQSFQ